jgi:NADPH2:quinone reductase
MKAVWFEKHGRASDVLQYGEMPQPSPGPGDVRVKVYASGVNKADTKERQPETAQPMVFPRVIPHQDGSGVIDAVGEGVSRARIGERVWLFEAQRGRPFGTAAEYVVLPARNASSLPSGTTFREGACLGIPAMTAHRCLFQDGAVRMAVSAPSAEFGRQFRGGGRNCGSLGLGRGGAGRRGARARAGDTTQ